MVTNNDARKKEIKDVLGVFDNSNGRAFVEKMCERFRPVFCEDSRGQDYMLGEQAPWLEIRDILNSDSED